MPALIKLTDAKCRVLRKRYDQGTPLVDMVEEFGFSRIVLTKGIKRAGGKIRRKGRKCEKPIKGRCQCRVQHSRPISPPVAGESHEQRWRRQGSHPPKGFPLQSHEIHPREHEGDQLVSDKVILSNKKAAKRTAIFFAGVGATVGLLCWEPWVAAPVLVGAVVYCVFLHFKYPGVR